jgi:hypothetical protein
MQRRLGHDFRHVRIHTDEGAARAAVAIGARAFTVGRHIAFAQGEFHPQLSEGRRVLAHELAHVMGAGRDLDDAKQQDRSTVTVSPRNSVSEHDASARAAAAANDVPAGGPSRSAALSTSGTADSIQRLPISGQDQRLDAYLDERGRLEIVPSGPMGAGRAEPAFELRPAEAGATVVGPGRHGPERRLGPDELPGQLRSPLREAARGMAPAQQVFRVPGCAELSVPGAARFLTFDEYSSGLRSDPGMLPLPRALFEITVARCGRPVELTPGTAQPEHARPTEMSEPATPPQGVHPDSSSAMAEAAAET